MNLGETNCEGIFSFEAFLRLTPRGLSRNIAPGDVGRAGLERLLRDCALPPFVPLRHYTEGTS